MKQNRMNKHSHICQPQTHTHTRTDTEVFYRSLPQAYTHKDTHTTKLDTQGYLFRYFDLKLRHTVHAHTDTDTTIYF